MNKMILTGFCLISVLSLNAFAEKEYRSLESRLDRLTKALELSDTQQQEVRIVFEGNQEKYKAIREQVKALKKETKESLNNILTSDQVEKLEEYEGRRKNMKAFRRLGHM